jgi:hypothetical protein
MPTLLRAGPYRVFMFMADCAECRHVHVECAGGHAKVWLEPVSVADHVGYSPRQLHRIRSIVDRERGALIHSFDVECGRASR